MGQVLRREAHPVYHVVDRFVVAVEIVFAHAPRSMSMSIAMCVIMSITMCVHAHLVSVEIKPQDPEPTVL